MQSSLIVLLPPIIVIIASMALRKIIPAFLLGIATAALIATSGNIIQSAQLAISRIWCSSGLSDATSISSFFSSWSLLIFAFLCCLGILITLLTKTGAAFVYTRLLKKYVHSKRSAESASLLLSTLFFIDDYFSALTVGTIMRPLARAHCVNPEKLAFLVTAMASPISILSPISSWVGEIVLQLKQTGIGPESCAQVVGDPYYVFLATIPFIIYPIVLIFATWYIVLRCISFGSMKKCEQNQHSYQDVFGNQTIHPRSTLFDFILPIGTLIGGVLTGFMYTGGYWLLGGTQPFFEALKNCQVHQGLFFGGALSVIVSFVYFLATGKIKIKDILPISREGIMLMLPSIGMLICAWSLGKMLRMDLNTGTYIAQMFTNFMNITMFPLICFIFSGITAVLIGSAWATIGLMFPIVIQMLQQMLALPQGTPAWDIALLGVVLGATLSGCVLGTHISPMADNPIMSAASSGAIHIDHLKTMFWYLIPVTIVTAIAYILLGFLVPILGLWPALAISLPISLISCIILLEISHKRACIKN